MSFHLVLFFTPTLASQDQPSRILTKCACYTAKDLTLEEIDLLWAEPEYIESRRAIVSQAALDKKALELKDGAALEVTS